MIENCSNFSEFMYYEYGYINQSIVAVNCYDRRTYAPFQLIPIQYQGWLLLTLLIIGTIAIGYGLYVIAHDPIDNTSSTDRDTEEVEIEDEEEIIN